MADQVDLSVVLSHTLRTLGIENRATLVVMLQFDLRPTDPFT